GDRHARVPAQSRAGGARAPHRAAPGSRCQCGCAGPRRCASCSIACQLCAWKAADLMRILVTGASGFIGGALVNDLAAQGHRVRAAMRQPADIVPRTAEVVAVSDLARPLEWRPLLANMDVVVHLAGIAHAGAGISEDVYDRVNRAATAALAAAAARNRIQRLVFVSSI